MVKIVLSSTPLSLGQGAALPGWYQDRGWQRCRRTVHGTRHSTCSCCRHKFLPVGKPHCTPAGLSPLGKTLIGRINLHFLSNSYIIAYCKGRPPWKENSALLFDNSAVFSKALCSEILLFLAHLWICIVVVVHHSTVNNFVYADQSAQAKGWWRRLPGHHSAPHGLPAGSTPKCPWVALERNYHCNPQKIPFSPMLTVRLMSGISQPIPAHLVLINSRQALSHHSEGTDFCQVCKSIQYYFSFFDGWRVLHSADWGSLLSHKSSPVEQAAREKKGDCQFW